MRHYQRRRAAAEKTRRPFEDDEAGSGTPAHSGTASAGTASEAELQMEMAQRPLSPSYFTARPGLPQEHSSPALSDGSAGRHYAVEPGELFMPSRAHTPEGANESSGSLPTFDYALEPSSAKFADGDGSFYSSEHSVHDDVDYTRRVWIVSCPRSARLHTLIASPAEAK